MLLNLFSIHAFATGGKSGGKSGGIRTRNREETVTYRRYNSSTGQMETVTGTRGRGGVRAQANRARRNAVRRANSNLAGPIRPQGRP